VEHGRDAIEECFTGLDVLGLHVAPGDGHPERGARLGVGARRGREARDAVPTLASIALADVERDGAESRAKLLCKVPVTTLDARHDG